MGRQLSQGDGWIVIIEDLIQYLNKMIIAFPSEKCVFTVIVIDTFVITLLRLKGLLKGIKRKVLGFVRV